MHLVFARPVLAVSSDSRDEGAGDGKQTGSQRDDGKEAVQTRCGLLDMHS